MGGWGSQGTARTGQLNHTVSPKVEPSNACDGWDCEHDDQKCQQFHSSPAGRRERPEIGDPYPIGAIGDCNLRVPIAEIAVEYPGLIVSADTITQAPLRHYAGGQWLPSPGVTLAGLARFAGRKAGSAGHAWCLNTKRPRRWGRGRLRR